MVRRRRVLATLGMGVSVTGCLRLEGNGTTSSTTAGTGQSTTAGASTTRTSGDEPDDPTDEPTETTADAKPVTALAGTWAQFRGDARNTGVSTGASGFTGDPVET
jgi:hypothetical protein